MNIDPILMCARCEAPTLHLFVERRPQLCQLGELPYVDCIYECDVCSQQRPWGNEPREETAGGRRLAAEDLAHAVDRHGMRRAVCPACGGGGLDCGQCDDDGQTWVFADPGPCGAACPLAGLGPLVEE